MSRHYEWKLGEPLPSLGEHSVAKHDIFEQYVGIYIERLTRTPSQAMLNLTIVDGFSGGGLYQLGSKEVDGSPLRLLIAVAAADAALKAARSKGFAVRADFFFVDANAQHVAFLNDLLGECQEFRVCPVMMGKKELPHGPTERTSDTGCAFGPAALRLGGECGL